MILIADTSALLGAFRSNDPRHQECADVYGSVGGFVYSPLVIAELDHLLQHRIGYPAASAAFTEICDRVATGRDEFAQLGPDDYLAARSLRQQQRDMPLDLADAFAVVLADKYGTDQIFTLGESVFRRLRPIGASFEHFRVLPSAA